MQPLHLIHIDLFVVHTTPRTLIPPADKKSKVKTITNPNEVTCTKNGWKKNQDKKRQKKSIDKKTKSGQETFGTKILKKKVAKKLKSIKRSVGGSRGEPRFYGRRAWKNKKTSEKQKRVTGWRQWGDGRSDDTIFCLCREVLSCFSKFLFVCLLVFAVGGGGGATPRRHARANDELTGMEEDGLF